PHAPRSAWGRTTTRCPALWRSPARLPQAFPGLRLRPAPTGARTVPSSRSCRFLSFGFPGRGIRPNDEAMSTPARCGLVVIARDQRGDRSGQFTAESGTVLGGPESHLGIDGKCREALVELFGLAKQLPDPADRPGRHATRAA